MLYYKAARLQGQLKYCLYVAHMLTVFLHADKHTQRSVTGDDCALLEQAVQTAAALLLCRKIAILKHLWHAKARGAGSVQYALGVCNTNQMLEEGGRQQAVRWRRHISYWISCSCMLACHTRDSSTLLRNHEDLRRCCIDRRAYRINPQWPIRRVACRIRA